VRPYFDGIITVGRWSRKTLRVSKYPEGVQADSGGSLPGLLCWLIRPCMSCMSRMSCASLTVPRLRAGQGGGRCRSLCRFHGLDGGMSCGFLLRCVSSCRRAKYGRCPCSTGYCYWDLFGPLRYTASIHRLPIRIRCPVPGCSPL